MPDTTAKIAAKGCTSTGITEDLAAALHNQLGKKIMIVAELEVAARSKSADGKETVQLRITTIEPAPNHDTENHLRELQRAFHYERKVADGQLQIESASDLEPKVKDVLAAGHPHLPHDHQPSRDDDLVCELCGANPLASIHQEHDTDQDDEDGDA